jgi:hypothetical protein
MSKENNIFELVNKLGYSIAGELGSDSFEEFELAYALSLLPRFSDNQLIRVRQHVLLYWARGFFKSTLINVFTKTIPEYFRVVDVTSTSPQMISGSINEEGKIVKPLFAGAHFGKLTELSTFVGTGPAGKEIVNTSQSSLIVL